MKAAGIPIRPLIKAKLHRISTLIEERTKEKKVYVLFHCKLSTILDPQAARNLVGKDDCSFLYSSSVDLVVCADSPDQRRIPLLVVDIDPFDLIFKQNLFNQTPTKYLAFKADKFDEFESVLIDTLDGLVSVPGKEWQRRFCRRWTPSEKEVHIALNKKLEAYGYVYLREISLTDVMDVPDSEKKRVEPRIKDYNQKNPNDRISRDPFSAFNFDGVVATKPPYSIPLFFVEVDGGSHDDHKASLKDQLKNGLCERSDYPLIRIRVGDGKDRDSHLVDLIAFFSEKLSHDVSNSKDHYGVLIDSLEHELNGLNDKDRQSDLTQLIVYVIRFYRRKLAALNESIAHLRDSNSNLYDELIAAPYPSFYKPHGARMEQRELVLEIEELLYRDPFFLYSWSYDVTECDSTQAIARHRSKQIRLIGELRSDIPEIGLKSKWLIEDEKATVRIFGSERYKEFFNEALIEFEKKKISSVARKRVSMHVNTDRDKFISNLRKWDNEIAARSLVSKIANKGSAEEMLRALKSYIDIPACIYRRPSVSDECLLAKKAEQIDMRLGDAIKALELGFEGDAEIKTIIVDDLKDYVRKGVAAIRVADTQEIIVDLQSL